MSKLLRYAFVVEYKKGSKNVVADALSRRGEVAVSEVVSEVHNIHGEFKGTAALHMMRTGQNNEEGEGEMVALSPASGALYIISFPTPTWAAELKASYEADSAIQTIVFAFQEGGNPPKGFSLVDGLLLFKGRIYLGSNSPLKSSILHHVHNGPLGGHSGYVKTLHRVKKDFYWHGMKKDLM